jgi:hypothetical protein
MAEDLADTGKIGGGGAAPSFNSFGAKVLGNMGPAGASVAANWSKLDSQTRGNIANAIVDSGAFAAGDVGAGAKAAEPHVNNAAAQVAAMNAASQARANQAEQQTRAAEDEAKKARWAAEDALNTPIPGPYN